MSLITLEEYKDYKKTTNDRDDDRWTVIIDSVNELIKAYCNRTFIDHYNVAQQVTIRPAEGVTTLILDEIPIKEIETITENGVDISADVLVNKKYGFVNYEFTKDSVVEISYTGGSPFTPADIRLAALELVDFYVNDEHKSRRTFGGSSIEYHEVSNQWPINIQYILNAHRDV